MSVRDIHCLTANINGGSELSYSLEIDFVSGEIGYTSFINSEVEEEAYFVAPYHELALFRQELEACDLYHWERNYPNHLRTSDGKQWYVEYILNGELVQINGDNNYPKGWEQFCQAVETLIKDSFR